MALNRELITQHFNRVKQQDTDMKGHMDTIKGYAQQCRRIAEFGVWDCTSTWALLAGFPEKMVSYDVYRTPEVTEVETATASAGINFTFILGSTVDNAVTAEGQPAVTIDEVDLLFIDTYHTYDHLANELKLHAGKALKFILLHDTTTFGNVDQTHGQQNGGFDFNGKGLWPAIVEFVGQNPQWKVRERFTHCNGLTVLERSAT